MQQALRGSILSARSCPAGLLARYHGRSGAPPRRMVVGVVAAGGGWDDSVTDDVDREAAGGGWSTSESARKSPAGGRVGGKRWSSSQDDGRGGGGGGGGRGGGWGTRRGDHDQRSPSSFGGRGGFRGGSGGRSGRGDAVEWVSRPSKSSVNSRLTGEVVYGVAPVLTALQKGRREAHGLYVQKGLDMRKRKDGAALRLALSEAEALGIQVEYAEKHDLNMMSDNRPHQGLLLDCSPLEWEAMESLPPPPPVADGAAPPLWLALDEVMDPQNFGAILRSAYFLGAAGVLACKRNSAPLSGVVSKASAGALEQMPVHSCSNLPRTLQDARDSGWLVLGAGAEEGSQDCSAYVMERPTVLVMGNEGYGLRTNVRRACDGMLSVGSLGGGADSSLAAGVESLNVSVAAGILLHSLMSSAAQPQR
eukprot:jgi/Tetstr1/450178/TSEL_037219.t1